MACHIDGYDFVAPGDVPRIQKDGELKLLERPAYDLGYLTINAAKPPMDKLLVREAVAHGLDRQKLADSFQPPGSAAVALQFQPPRVFGFAADAPQYAFQPAESKRQLRLAGLKLPVDDPALFSLVQRGAAEPARAERESLYRQANRRVLEVLPGVPLVSTKEQVPLRNGVEGYITTPFGPESFAGVSVLH